MKLVLQITAGIILAIIILAIAQCSIVIGTFATISKIGETKLEEAKIKESIKEHEMQEELAIKAQKAIELEKAKQNQQEEKNREQAERDRIARVKLDTAARKSAEFKKWYKPLPECEKIWKDWETLMKCTNDKMVKEKEFFERQ